MRHLLIIYLLGQSVVAWGQRPYDDKRLPFQVLFADKVENSKGQAVKSLDLISIREVLVIRKGGFLSMIHYFGFPLEIEGDTTVNIRDVQKEFDLLKLGKKKDKYSNLKRPYVEYLHITDSNVGRKNKLTLMRPCHPCPDFEIIFPPKYRTSEILFHNDLCLTWESTGSSNYEIDLKNMFDEKVVTYTTTTNELKVGDKEMKTLIDREKVLLLTIKDGSKNRASDISIISKFRPNSYEYPYSCTPRKATYALMSGFYIEISQGNHDSEAEKYYRLAVGLSDRQFFKTMLDNFIKRHP